MSTQAKCEAACADVDPECCDDPCGASCSSTQAKCEASCDDVDPACCDDPCGSECSSTSAKCEAGCEGVDPACCDDPCGGACGSPAAKCEAACGDVSPECCEDPCGASCTDFDAKCEAECENLPEDCCSEEGTESEEGCECPEPSCSTTLEGDRVCGGESLTLPFSITNTVDPEEECMSTFEWELIQQPPFGGPIFGPRRGSVALAPGESVELEELYDLSPDVTPGIAWMQLDVTSDDSLVCTAEAEVEV
ncbi:MAG: hypothetical protein AAF368_05655, partial [Planctomycetota bacterium]